MSGSNQFSLLGQRRFAPFFATQFLGALNDNIFRNGLVILITFQGIVVAGMDHTQLANIAAGLVVRKIGVATVTPGEIQVALHQRGQGGRSQTSMKSPC